MSDRSMLRLVEPDAAATPEVDNELWGVEELARFLGMSTSWVYRSTEAGLVPYRRVGRSLRFLPAEIRAWVARQPGRTL